MTFNEISFYYKDTQVTWHGIIVAIGLLSAILIALTLRMIQGEKIKGVLVTVGLSCIISPVLARFVFWYCCSGQFSDFISAMTDYSGGGFSLVGIIAGVFLSVYLTKLLGVEKNIGGLLDCICPAGVFGIAVARLGGFFTTADKGKFIITDEKYHKLPFSFPIENSAGEFEWRIPTFLYEAIASFVIFLIAFITLVIIYRKGKNAVSVTGLLTMSLFGFVQAVLESMRYDTLFTRFNGFVSLIQIVCVLIAITPLIVFTVRRAKVKQYKFIHGFLTVLTAGCLGVAGYMEYYVQRHADMYIKCYSLMLIMLMIAFIFICFTAIGEQKTEE